MNALVIPVRLLDLRALITLRRKAASNRWRTGRTTMYDSSIVNPKRGDSDSAHDFVPADVAVYCCFYGDEILPFEITRYPCDSPS